MRSVAWDIVGIEQRLGWVLVVGLVVMTAQGIAQVPSPAAPGPTGTPAILHAVGIVSHAGAQIPLDLLFQDDAAKVVRLGDYFTKRPVILALVYYKCPGLCTMVLNDLTRTLNSLTENAGSDFEVVAVSFDPTETPSLADAKKQQYLRAYRRPGDEQGWHFLTGRADAISRLTSCAGFKYAWDDKNKQWAHESGLMILTPGGTISRYLFGIDYAPADLQSALADARGGRIAAPADVASAPAPHTALYCFYYDPSTGRYGLIVMRALRVGGVLVMLLIGGSIWLMIRRDRRIAVRGHE